jgi:heme-degrading monooxygenase HmoA
MKKSTTTRLILLLGMFWIFPANSNSQTTRSKTIIKMKTSQTDKKSATSAQILIDKFIVPANAIPEFTERMNINREFIKNLPGFMEDAVYQRADEQGNLICVTVAVWATEDALKKAKEAVQAEYKKQGFNFQAMIERLNITIDRGVYEKAAN